MRTQKSFRSHCFCRTYRCSLFVCNFSREALDTKMAVRPRFRESKRSPPAVPPVSSRVAARRSAVVRSTTVAGARPERRQSFWSSPKKKWKEIRQSRFKRAVVGEKSEEQSVEWTARAPGAARVQDVLLVRQCLQVGPPDGLRVVELAPHRLQLVAALHTFHL